MTWPHSLSAFFAGMFLANAVPHFTHGISGDRFPTPFAKPPGKGLSSPIVNTLWAILNLIVGTLLFRAGNVFSSATLPDILFFAGITAISLMLAINFATKHTS